MWGYRLVKVMMMLSSSITAVFVVLSPVLSVVGLECSTVSLVVSFIFMVPLVQFTT
jgi:hypothetical protein